jgi:type II secretory pathway pseudopilin PulG
MKMSRKRFYLISAIILFAAVSLAISFLVWKRWANQNALIEREQAIQNAIQACNLTYGLQTVEQPTVFEAQLTKFGSAMGPYNPDPERPVWLITLKGRWLHVSGGPPPAEGSNPKPSYWDECTIIIDDRLERH